MGYIRELVKNHYISSLPAQFQNAGRGRLNPVRQDFLTALKDEIESDNDFLAAAGLDYGFTAELTVLKCEMMRELHNAIVIFKTCPYAAPEIVGSFVHISNDDFMGHLEIDWEHKIYGEREHAYPLQQQHIDMQTYNVLISNVPVADRKKLGAFYGTKMDAFASSQPLPPALT